MPGNDPTANATEASSSDGSTRKQNTIDGSLAEAIVATIIKEPLAPGTPLREVDLVKRFSVSRPTVRAALRIAALTGFVEVAPFRGASVAQITESDLSDILQLLETTYAQSAALAASRRSAEELAELEDALQDITQDFMDHASHDALIRKSFAFGDLVAGMAHSSFVRDFMRQCGRLVLWQQRLVHPDVEWFERQSLDCHTLLAWAISSENPEIAKNAAETIVKLTRQAVVR